MTSEPLRLLVVSAHPHDFTHCAGTCGIHTARGDSVTVVSVTSGAYTHNEELHDELMKPEAERDPAIINRAPEEYAAGKETELRRACAIFGITDVRILGFPQPFRLEHYPESIEALRDVILDVRAARPDYDQPLVGRSACGHLRPARRPHGERARADGCPHVGVGLRP